MDFPKIPPDVMLRRLDPPAGKVSMVLDTDTYNEIDDQFAVVQALLSPEKLNVEAIHAAPFGNKRSNNAGDGMEKSYQEILRLLDRLGRKSDGFVFRGSTDFLDAPDEPMRSPAALDLIERALAPRDAPLYVAAIGAITNVASAILLEPRIVDRIVVVWLGGQPRHWHTAWEFNLKQDPHASRLIFDCGVPLVHVPCQHVSALLQTTVAEMERYVKGRGPIGDYLFEIFAQYVGDQPAKSKVIWDIATIAWLLDARWLPTHVLHSPILTAQLTWSADDSRHFMREAFVAHRDPIFRNLFEKLERAARPDAQRTS